MGYLKIILFFIVTALSTPAVAYVEDTNQVDPRLNNIEHPVGAADVVSNNNVNKKVNGPRNVHTGVGPKSVGGVGSPRRR